MMIRLQTPRLGLLALAAGAALAGCRPPDQGKLITEADAPRLRPGLWRQTHQVDADPAATSVFCAQATSLAPPRMGACSRYELRLTATGAFIADAVCSPHGMTATTHSEMTGDFGSHFTEDNSISTAFPGETPTTSRAHIGMQYLGPCPVGAKAP